MFSVNNNCNSSYFDLLVDCGSTTQILNDESKIINSDEDFDSTRHNFERADGSRYTDLALKWEKCLICMDILIEIFYKMY